MVHGSRVARGTAGGLHLHALTEPHVNLSIHTALLIQPTAGRTRPVRKRAWLSLGDALSAGSLHAATRRWRHAEVRRLRPLAQRAKHTSATRCPGALFFRAIGWHPVLIRHRT